MKTARPFIHTLIPLFLTFVLLLVASPARGQKREVDAVYLNTGEIYRGRIVENIHPDLVQLETLCHDTRLFSKDEILWIQREKIRSNAGGFYDAPSVRGYFNHTDLGFLIGSGNNDRNVIFGFQMINGYKLGKRYYPGIGTGIEFYDQAYVPLFADFKYFLGDQRVSPFLRGKAGYTLPVEDPPEQWGSRTDNRGGLMFCAGAGTSIRTGTSSTLVISLEYRFQNLTSVYTEDWNDEILNLKTQYNRVALRVGFIFD